MSIGSMRLLQRVGGLLAAAVLAGCVGGQGIGVGTVAGYDGLGRQIQTFYAQRAWEKGASCPLPTISRLMRAEVVEENTDTVVLAVRYSWVDESRAQDGNRVRPGGGNRCRDIDERRFTLAKQDDGSVRIVEMSGPQRQRPLGAVRS